MHPFDGAYEQVNGGWEHLDVLKPEIRTFSRDVADNVSLEYQRGTVNIAGRESTAPIGKAKCKTVQAPQKVSRLIGEVIQNSRKALDYLVYEVARFDAHHIVDNTQFPVADKEENFEQLLRRYNLRGNLTPEHIAALKRLQPFEGCEWTRWLTDHSNPDKHRFLTVVKSPVVIKIDPSVTEAKLAGEHVDAENYTSVQITFSDGAPVIESLEQLLLKTIETLDSFKPQIK